MKNNETNARAADYIATRLYEAGCRYAFGMPGGEVLTIVDALEKAGIEFVLCKHENSAGFMAEGVHHRTGAPGILVATVGPGVVNGTNAIANALQDRVPLIVLTGCVDATEALTYTHQVIDHEAIFKPITKATFRLTAEGADIIADKAVSIAMEGRSGPVLIDVPISVADEEPGVLPIRRRAQASPVSPALGTNFDQAREWLSEAKKPIMVIGLDAIKDGASEVIQKFIEKYNIPFITTYKAKGLVSESHLLSLGGAGLSPLADKTLVPFVESADLILCVGYDPIEMRTGWREIWDPKKVNVIDITAVDSDHYMHQSSISFIADTRATLTALQQDVSNSKTWVNGEIENAKKNLASDFSSDVEWGPAAVIDECRKGLPKNTIATVDSGAHRILLSQIWRCYEPSTLLQSSALCTMGCAVPLAMGAKIAEPNRTVVSFSGDGGMLMVAGELSTAAELNANTIFVVFVDASLALIELKQRHREMKNAAVDFDRHDFEAIGKAFGGNSFTVESRTELKDALEAAQSSKTFTVIAAIIDRHAYDGLI
ncbi:MAG: thiamine pyrophosphate-binding protein [Granulosicoccaceae bacterium]